MPAWTSVSNPGQWVRDSRAWLPVNPTSEFLYLSDARRRVYIDRFAADYHLSGWLVQAGDSGLPASWLIDDLSRNYHVTRTFKSGNWTVSWYQYQGGSGQ